MVATIDREPLAEAEDRSGFDLMARLLKLCSRWMQERREKVQISYLIPERSGYGWYVVAKDPAFDFEMNRELAELGVKLVRQGFAVHAVLLPGSISPAVPTDGIAISPMGQIATHAH